MQPISSQPPNTSPYSIHVSSENYTRDAMITVTVNGTKAIKGFIIQARAVGDARPVGTFQGPLSADQTFLWCSGGEEQNTVAHHRFKPPNGSLPKSLEFTWKAPGYSVGNITFWGTFVESYTIFWVSIQSVTVHGPTADPQTPPTIQPSFAVTKDGCGSEKGCYSEPEDCTNSSNCIFLVTYQRAGENITFEMSGKHGYVAVGFNSKQEMDQTDTITCSTSASRAVEIRHYFMDFHQPIRTNLGNSTDIIRHAAAYENGTMTCRFVRKISPTGSNMTDLTKNWFFIFAWTGVTRTGVLNYHVENASFTAERVNVTRPAILKNGRKLAPVPTPDGKLEFLTSKCGDEKSCYFEPDGCSSSGTCDYLVTFEPCEKKDNVNFELSAKSDWVAIGFNDEGKMDGTDTIICSRLNDGSVAIEHYTLNGYNSPVQTKPTPAGLTVISGAFEDGVIKCRFSRNKTASSMFRLDKEVFLIYARGSVSGGILNKHTHRSWSADKVDVCKLNAPLKSETPDTKLLKAHGSLMVLAWVGFATLAIFAARYMKDAWGKLFGKKKWFQIHRAMTVCCLICTLVGFVLVFVHVEGWSEADVAHSVLGIIITFLVCVQPIMALMRPGPTAENRCIFNWAHRSVGVTAFILGIANIFLGLRLPHLDTEFGVYFMVAFCVGLLPVVVLEIYLMRGKKQQGVFYMTFGFIAVLVTSACLALLLLITMAT
ncbi:putative ferric-chelate reductase 1 [Orbicella faveolata]|uniref:putative ferric-chelate reductase 1 n=1 Tax=Orbicella faveolata TaxID=48498 RepID=UPI0009E6347D|nr:putative ferric-chelate reductase 1 [Orbicella faveolata]